MTVRTLWLSLLLGLGALTAGCKSDCAKACERKQECVASGMDVGQCTEQCEAKVKKDENLARQAEQCSVCLKDRTCSEVVPQCLGACITVVGF